MTFARGRRPARRWDGDGCSILDTDGDGVTDQKDWCPGTPTGGAVDEHGCWTKDTDGDTVTDQLDGCPLDPNKVEPGVCGCGVPEGKCDWYKNVGSNCGLGGAALMPLTCLGLLLQRRGGRRA